MRNKVFSFLLLLCFAVTVFSNTVTAETQEKEYTEDITINVSDVYNTAEIEEAVAQYTTTKDIDGITYNFDHYKIVESNEIKKAVEVEETITVVHETDDEYYHPEDPIEKNGLIYKFKIMDPERIVIDDGKHQALEKVVNYYDYESQNDIPSAYVEDGKVLKQTKIEKTADKKENVNITIDITLGDALYFYFNSHLIKYDESDPGISIYINELYDSLGLDRMVYTLNSVTWEGPSYIANDGIMHRNAVVSGYKELADYSVTYTENVTTKPIYTYKYTTTYEVDKTQPSYKNAKEIIDHFELKIKLTYKAVVEVKEPVVVNDKQNNVKPIVIGVVAILIILLLSVIILYRLQKKGGKNNG